MGYHPIWQKPELDPAKGRFEKKFVEPNLTTVAIEVLAILAVVGGFMMFGNKQQAIAATPTESASNITD